MTRTTRATPAGVPRSRAKVWEIVQGLAVLVGMAACAVMFIVALWKGFLF